MLHRPHTEEKEVVIMRIFAKVQIDLATKRGNADQFFYDATAWVLNMKTHKLQKAPGAVAVRASQDAVLHRMAASKAFVYVSAIGGVGSYVIPAGMLDNIPDGYFWLSITDIL